MFADLIATHQWQAIFQLLRDSKDLKLSLNHLLQKGIRPLLPEPIKKAYQWVFKKNRVANHLGLNSSYIFNIDEQPELKNLKTFHERNFVKLIFFSQMHSGLYAFRKYHYLGYGINLITPYYNKRILNFFSALPVTQISNGWQNRRIQKNALQRYNLNHIYRRKSKTAFFKPLTKGVSENHSALRKTLTSSELIRQGIIKQDVINKLLNTQDPIKIATAGMLLMSECWLSSLKRQTESHNQVCHLELQDGRFNLIKDDFWSL